MSNEEFTWATNNGGFGFGRDKENGDPFIAVDAQMQFVEIPIGEEAYELLKHDFNDIR